MWTDGTVQHDNSSRKVNVWIGPDGERDKFKMTKVLTVQNVCSSVYRPEGSSEAVLSPAAT